MDLLDMKEFVKDTIKYALIVILILFIVIYVITLEQVIGPSMSPTLKSNDVVILNKFIYKFKDIKRGDIVSFNYSDTKYLIKRIIGLPGESVEIRDNKVYIGDKVLNEPYLKNIDMDDFSLYEDLGYQTIPKDMYFVLGDNRNNSKDSRNIEVGLIKKSDIVGRVKVRIWPLNKIGAVN